MRTENFSSRPTLNNISSCFSIFYVSAFLLILLTFQFSASGQNDDEVIKVDSSIVIVNVTVTDANGKAVTNLKANQFKVFVDGQEQKIDFFEPEKTSFAAVILMDTSGSMDGSISLARSAAINFLDGLRTEDVTAIYNFDSKVSLVQDFSNDRDIVDKIFNLKADGMTVLNDAIYKASVELGKRAEKRRAIVVLSDGADTKSGRTSEKALKAALEANALIYTIDMSLEGSTDKARFQNQSVLKNFAEKSGGKFIKTPGGIALRETFKNIVEELGNQYTLTYQPTDTKKDGKWRAIEVKVAKPNLIIRTRKGYNAAKEK